MAVRVQNFPKKTFDESSVRSLSHLSVSCTPWWSLNEQQIEEPLPHNISLKVETPSQLYHQAKHLDLQLPDQELTTVQAIDRTHCEVGAIGVTSSQRDPSESAGPFESCEKDTEGQVKPVFLVNNPNTLFSPSHQNYNHSMACTQYPYANAYFNGLFTPYGPQAIIQAQLGGNAPTRIPLPLDLAEDEPIYVNPKQYHGILRRRQYRAKLEAQNKLVKSRKPYLHESRHRHALNRVRGSGGRFLSKKTLQQPNVICNNQTNSISELESHYSRMAGYDGPNTSCMNISSVSNNDCNFQRLEHGFANISRAGGTGDGIRHGASVVQ
ncbi:hypothetical protein ERO13_A13G192100v2 [Gossypium hirsutum]|uniref:Nuclear transcription factor Y subunit n=1 Tax=Gossypium hirsutum TaxID=3635 RepID=A0A1U8IDB3_GOSHI|nr:nuclear transcription factor Y subunit A-7 isoform X1 [Gossypium hirsutum]XP_016673793.2 nuclear transcription factor Y subunit A-7 isoform X1 [Gossypium hirsutum]XP_016673794.2 nuclear transcription factor Y subunit A-7 isoform X1 [Gossypium hirsutum]XP_016673795.2 nuclear transcription factor Y subunit A-7 isoform X1 [Gossypium hirsutum]XP_040941578.1 nuclear transcription factor Y subunit A-7 isoform X1 [Gossypium hirsutum]KAG4167397.1 hypothetical protein ERO13_A13G192100v2 [Gossypium h